MEANIKKYMGFVKTVEYNSFTKAAEILDYSQSGISRMIHDLEKDWKVILLERGKAGIRLTSAGLILLPYAKNICTEYEKLQMEIDKLNGLQSGLIRIGTFSSVATHWLPNIIKAFQKDYPGIDYELLIGDYAELEEWIGEGRIDCAFLRLPTCPEFETIFIEQDKLLAILPENHPLAGCDKFPISEFCKEPFLLLEKGSNTEVYQIFEHCNLTPNVRFKTWDDYAIMSMVENGLGISILPQLILKRIPYHVVIKELDVPACRDIGLALRSQKNASLAVKRFLDYLSYH